MVMPLGFWIYCQWAEGMVTQESFLLSQPNEKEVSNRSFKQLTFVAYGSLFTIIYTDQKVF